MRSEDRVQLLDIAIIKLVDCGLSLQAKSSSEKGGQVLMAIKIGSYQFEGPYTNTGSLADRSGIYAILDAQSGQTVVVDIGESAHVKTRVENHDRSGCWRQQSIGQIQIAVYYTPNAQQYGRRAIEQQLRQIYQPLCGVN